MDRKARPAILIILDGFGVNPDRNFNAVAEARAPVYQSLLASYPHTVLDASQSHVGLPNGFMGNSEVGHLNIGAGRVVYQDFSLISHAIEDGTFFTNPVFMALLDRVKQQKERPVLHLMGLVSDGGVHSHISHLFALLQMARRNQIHDVALHVFTDGRDTSPTAGIDYVHQLLGYCADVGVGRVATVMGRFYAMDRDKRWDRVERAYRAIIAAEAESTFDDPVAFIRDSYESKVTDEFIAPGVARGYAGVKDGDGILFFNFRADRAREITRAITQPDFDSFRRQRIPKLSGFVQLTNYDESLPVPVAFVKDKVPRTLGEVVSGLGWKQLRIAETEKYAHVTYFFNGGEERVFEGEKRILVPSPRDVKTYDLKPEMSAREVTDKLLGELQGGAYRFIVVNYANPDMVGHTGNFGAAVQAVEVVDQCLGEILQWIESTGAIGIVTADHGNCEAMQDSSGQPLTSHTLMPVPFIVIDPLRKELALRSGGSLCDIAPTLLDLWGIAQPAEMTGHSLIAR